MTRPGAVGDIANVAYAVQQNPDGFAVVVVVWLSSLILPESVHDFPKEIIFRPRENGLVARTGLVPGPRCLHHLPAGKIAGCHIFLDGFSDDDKPKYLFDSPGPPDCVHSSASILFLLDLYDTRADVLFF